MVQSVSIYAIAYFGTGLFVEVNSATHLLLTFLSGAVSCGFLIDSEGV